MSRRQWGHGYYSGYRDGANDDRFNSPFFWAIDSKYYIIRRVAYYFPCLFGQRDSEAFGEALFGNIKADIIDFLFCNKIFWKIDFLIHRTLYLKVEKLLSNNRNITFGELYEYFRFTKHEIELSKLMCKNRVTYLHVLMYGEPNRP